MKKQKIAIIGLGNWGKKILNEFSKVSDIVFVCTKGKNSNKQWLEDNYKKIKHTTDYDLILKDSSIDAVVIVTPISTHFNLAKKALFAKKHVFLEKPAATSSRELKGLIKIAEKFGKVLFIDHIFSYHPNFSFLKKLLKNQKITSISTRWLKWGSFSENIYWNLSYHDLYLVSDIIESMPPTKIIKNIETKNKIDISLETKKDVIISLHINRLSIKKKKIFKVKTLKAEYVWDGNFLYEYKDEKYILLNENKTQPMPLMISDFLKLIEEQKKGLNQISAYEIVKLIENRLHKF